MKRALVLSFALACAAPAERAAGVDPSEARGVARVEAARPNRWYGGRREPLEPSSFSKLPLGAVQPRGWLRAQLELQMAGFHGHLGEISAFLRKDGNAWLSPTGAGDHGWEEVPYWLKGFGDCAYLLGDEPAIAEARLWIEGALASQRPDGFFGPRGNGAKATVASTEGTWDLWPNMPMIDALRSWYEFSADERIPPFLARYFRWELTLPDEQFVPPYWQHLRAYDNLWSAQWLHDRSDDEALRADLRALCDKIRRCAARWEDGVIDWHNVNVLQGFGGPTWHALQTHDEHQRGTAERNFQEFRGRYGQVPGGLFGADEVARPGATDPRQAVETCGMVEFLYSCERLILATGDPVWADRLEDVAFNSLPGAQTPDLRALRYLSAPNLAVSDRRSHNPGIMNGGPMFCFDPNDHRCCQHNVGHGWPYLAQHLWMATADDGLCLMIPLASQVRARVGAHGGEVELECSSDYPFETGFELSVKAGAGEPFPLYVRVPGWARGVTIAGDDGVARELEAAPRGFVRIERAWGTGERLRLEFAAEREVQRWTGNKGAATIRRGPLTYALAIPRRIERSGGSDAWPAFELFPAGPWNYALDLSSPDPVTRVERKPMPDPKLVWDPSHVPERVYVRARRVPSWGLDLHGLVAKLVASPVAADTLVEEVALIPMGAARLRITAFPVAGDGRRAREWPAPPVPPHPDWTASASHCFHLDTPQACLDGATPERSDDGTIPRLTWWPERGNTQWVQYDFPAELEVAGCEVYWFDDTGAGGCAVPAAWRIEGLDPSGAWVELPAKSQDPAARDAWCAITFQAPVKARALRLVADLQSEKSGGVLEWRVRTTP